MPFSIVFAISNGFEDRDPVLLRAGAQVVAQW